MELKYPFDHPMQVRGPEFYASLALWQIFSWITLNMYIYNLYMKV